MCSQLSSIPGINWISSSFAASFASSRPEVISWSVKAIKDIPAFWASAITSFGDSVPSEANEWQWNSALILIVNPPLKLKKSMYV